MLRVDELVALPAVGADQLRRELPAQAVDQDLDRVGVAILVVAVDE
jgi:hypothetical protein